MQQTLKNTLCLFVFICIGNQMSGQGWERLFGTVDDQEAITRSIPTRDGGCLALMYRSSTSDATLLKLSPEGVLEWSKLVSSFGQVPTMIKNPAGGYLISPVVGDISENLCVGIDSRGRIIWKKEAPAYYNGIHWTAVDDGFIVSWREPLEIIPNIRKIDVEGDSLWQIAVDVPGIDRWGVPVQSTDGGFAIGGITSDTISIFKFDSDGALSETWSTGLIDSINKIESSLNITQTNDGGFAVMVSKATSGDLPVLVKFSPEGDVDWTKIHDEIVPGATINSFKDMIEASDGSLVLVGTFDINASPKAYLVKFSPEEGELIFARTYSEASTFGNLAFLKETPTGHFLTGGISQLINSGDAYLILADPEGNVYPNAIEGQIALDSNNDCNIDNGENMLEGWTVRASGSLTFFDQTDAHGHYLIELDTGEYTLETFPPNALWTPCENPVETVLPNVGDTLTVDFPVQALTDCPSMQVDIATPYLRRCFENTLSLHYCNAGTQTAQDVAIEVTLDSLLEYVNSDILPTGQTGNTFTFPIGDVEINECGSFNITAFVNCDAVLGQALCMEAHVTPDTICAIPFNWSGASMEARAQCIGDTTILLELENVGTNPTSQAIEYIVIEDQVISFEGSQTFAVTETYEFEHPANGSTWRIISEQEPNHPGLSIPNAFVEGCGLNQSGSFSIGFTNEHPMADGDGFVDIDCETVVSSFDPNDKTGYPIGYGEEYFIEPNTDLEYRIRFQNTGTDTAFTVVIRDTLSNFLNRGSIRPGASSHPYDFDYFGDGVAVFRFSDIMLPDSNMNEPLSHGFVSFKISQQPDLEPGTVITNSAAIYFDFNEAVITNESAHTIEEDFIISATIDSKTEYPGIKVYPNPVASQAIFEVEAADLYQQLTLKLFDGTGRLVRQEGFTEQQLIFQRKDLPQGIWFFQIEADGKTIGTGKLVIVGK